MSTSPEPVLLTATFGRPGSAAQGVGQCTASESARRSPRVSASISASDRSSFSAIHCRKATPNTVTPVSAASVAVGLDDRRVCAGPRSIAVGEPGQLQQLALLQARVGDDDRLPRRGIRSALVGEERRGRLQRERHRVERAMHPRAPRPHRRGRSARTRPARRTAPRACRRSIGRTSARSAPPLGDVCGRRPSKPRAANRLQRGRLQPLARAGLPPHHGRHPTDGRS